MGREVLQRVYLEFDEDDKNEVLEILKKLFGGDYHTYNLLDEGKEYSTLEFNSTDYNEEDFKELKEICSYIRLSNYEYFEDEGFIWEREDEDELKKIVSKKLRQIKKKKEEKKNEKRK